MSILSIVFLSSMLFSPESCSALVHGNDYFYLITSMAFCYFGIYASFKGFFDYLLILDKKLTDAEKFFDGVPSIFSG